MGKITKYFGQTIFSQIFSLIPLKEIISIISNGGYDKYTKKFNSIDHLITLLYGVLKGFDSLREITNDLSINEKRLKKAGLSKAPSRSTISDANNRRSASFFGNVYSMLYGLYANFLSNISDSGSQKWLRLLHVIDSTTITLFSSILKGAGRNPISGKKKGGIKSHCIMRYYANVPFFVRFTSAATHDSVMNKLIDLAAGSIIAMDRAYIDYALFERFTSQGVIYVTKMKKSLTYEVEGEELFVVSPDGLVEVRIKTVLFRKGDLCHKARMVTYWEKNKKKAATLITNDFTMDYVDIINIYRKRWAIELLFKQLKQNFQLHTFYGESVNAIESQIWVTLIANLLMTVVQRKAEAKSSSGKKYFSNIMTITRAMMLYYINLYKLLADPEAECNNVFEDATQLSLPLFKT